jgi:asparagine synthase (glutamine-hydrolysing)
MSLVVIWVTFIDGRQRSALGHIVPSMCGIAGVVGATWSAPELAVHEMLRHLEHRGPDEEGIADVAGATLGVRRLAIIDVLRGHQPMANETGNVFAIQNGELYNYRDLRAELLRRGHRFQTDSDTEVLPHLYEEYGPDFARHLRGMFAIAVWDARTETLVLTRDRLGKKPLLYAETERGLAFASEIQALLALPVARNIDDQAIRDYLVSGYVGSPRTAFRAIRKIRPGHTLTVRGGSLEEHSYWRLSFSPKTAIREEEAVDELRSRIAEAVRLRLISDVPLGAFLSGGLDSSTIVAFMAQESALPVKTFSIGFTDQDHDELHYARLVAERFGTDHHEFVVDPAAADILPMLVRHLGEPFADASIVPTYQVARIARQHVTVALNGDGGDELFAGYERYRAALFMRRFEIVPRPGRTVAAALARRLPEPAWLPGARRARRVALTLGMSPRARYERWTGFFADRPAILGARLRGLPRSTSFDDAIAEAQPSDELDEMLAIDTRNYLPGDLLVKMDIATMAASLEGRSPFLDHELVSFMAQLPSSLKLRDGESKHLLRRVMQGVLPDEILKRPKMGFGAPVGRWLKGPLRGLVSDVLLDAPDRGYVDQAEVRRVVDEHFTAPNENGLRVWCLLMLELWFREVAESSARSRIDAA